MSKTHLSVLIQLAKVDGKVVQEEVNYIIELAKANDVSETEVDELFRTESTLAGFDEFSEDQKFDLIYAVVQLMKIDGKLYNEEIKFCARMAAKLGYSENVLFELMLRIYADPDLCADKASLKSKIQSYDS